MCGIVAGVSGRDIVPVLVQGLQRLEYRGYDSCGVAVHGASLPGAPSAGLRRARSTSRVAELMSQVGADGVQGGTGIAHTRWATHGAPAMHNAHPHFSHGPGADAQARAGRVALVHNGIIENHEELRATLQARGYVFASQTDTEEIAHLVDLREALEDRDEPTVFALGVRPWWCTPAAGRRPNRIPGRCESVSWSPRRLATRSSAIASDADCGTWCPPSWATLPLEFRWSFEPCPRQRRPTLTNWRKT